MNNWYCRSLLLAKIRQWIKRRNTQANTRRLRAGKINDQRIYACDPFVYKTGFTRAHTVKTQHWERHPLLFNIDQAILCK